MSQCFNIISIKDVSLVSRFFQKTISAIMQTPKTIIFRNCYCLGETLNWFIQLETFSGPYYPSFGVNTGKYGLEKIP